MKKMAVNIMATTGMSLVLLSAIAAVMGGSWVATNTIFQTFVANVIIHFGLILVHKIECKYMVFEAVLDIGFMLVILIVFGAVFSWYSTTPIWVLALMALIVYLFSFYIKIFKSAKQIQAINELLQQRDNKPKI